MEKLPVEIFDLIVVHLTLTDWKCLRLTCRTIYTKLSTFSSYSHLHSITLSPKSSSAISLGDRLELLQGIDRLSLANFDFMGLDKLIQQSESFRSCLKSLTSLSFACSTTLIDSAVFYKLLEQCSSLEKLDLSDYKFFFLSHNFSLNSNTFPSIKRLNLNGNVHLSDYAFNRIVAAFPNIEELHLCGIPLRSSISSIENRTYLTFENVHSYFQKNLERLTALTISFDKSLACDTQVKRLFIDVPPRLIYLHIDGTLSISALLHLLLVFNNCLETLIIKGLKLDHTGCKPLFAGVSEYATNLKQLCIFLHTPTDCTGWKQQKSIFSAVNQVSDLSLSTLEQLRDLDIQTLYSLNEADLINVFGNNLKNLKKLALPKNTTDDVMRSMCTQSLFAASITHLNLTNCPTLSNRSLLLVNKYMSALEELIINCNTNINDFAFIGLSICGIGKTIEWLSPTMIQREFINDASVWTYTLTHQSLCKCQLPDIICSLCIKLRLREFSFDYDEHSEQSLRLLTGHKLFDEYSYSINKLMRLKTLKLHQCVHITNRLFRFGIRSLPNLTYLDISACEKLTDRDLSLLGQACPILETIDISGCHGITDKGKQVLKDNAKRLKIVDF